jgi:NadR type nicotinamide-nucleotide adenylyltransferase
MINNGLIIGKFMPPHNGHRYCFDVASRLCNTLFIVIDPMEAPSIPVELRLEWIQAICPQATVLVLPRTMPQDPSDTPEFWKIWRIELHRLLPCRIDAVFASESYGKPLAEHLGALFVSVDIERRAHPISATLIRQNPRRYWSFIPDVVRPYFLKRIAIVGPECSGKTTLVKALHDQFGLGVVPEFADSYLRVHGTKNLTQRDFDLIGEGQYALIRSAECQSGGVLVSDTDPLSTCIWADQILAYQPDHLRQLQRKLEFDYIFLCQPDIPWKDDAHRLFPQRREIFLEVFRSEYLSLENVHELSGSIDDRISALSFYISDLLK